MYIENEQKKIEDKKEEEPIEISLGNFSSKHKLSNQKEDKKVDKNKDKKNEFENEKNNIENCYKKLIEDSLKEQEIKFNKIKEEEINKWIKFKTWKWNEKCFRTTKKIYEEKIEKVSNEKEKQIRIIKPS